MKKRSLFLLAFFIGSFFLFLGISDLKYYGPNWDEAVHFVRGYAFLHYFLTGEKDYKRLEKSPPVRKSHYQLNYYNYKYLEQQISDAVSKKQVGFAGGGHPPLSDVLAAALNYILYSKLGILGDIESFHFYGILLGAILSASLFYFVAKQYNIFAASITTLAFFLHPFFLGESRFNIKDIPETAFYTFTLLFFYKGVIENKGKWIFISSLFFGFALGTKLNIIFIPFIIFPWLIIFYAHSIKKEGIIRFFNKRRLLFLSNLAYPIVGFGIFVGTWPILWSDLWNRLMTVINYYENIAIEASFDPRFFAIFGLKTYAILWIIITTPLVTLFLVLCGISYALTKGLKEKNKTVLLILLWYLVPIARVTIPNAAIYGGVRQIMEYIPAMAILSGIGAGYIVTLLHGLIVKNLIQVSNRVSKQWSNRVKVILQFIVILSFIPITLKIISLHPNESIYFNPLIGGLKGAKEKNIPGWGNSLGSTYRQGVNWLNEHAEPNAKLATVYELKSSIPEEIILRKDIRFVNSFRSTTRHEGEYIIGVTHYSTFEDQYHRKYLDTYLNPIYDLQVDGVSVLMIWKNDLAHTKEEYRRREQKIENITIQRGERTLQINLLRIVKITKIIIHYNPQNCTPPSNGYFERSVFGKKWQKSGGDFLAIPFSTWFKTQPEKGILQFVFAAEKAQFIQLVINDENSCLLVNPLAIEAFHL